MKSGHLGLISDMDGVLFDTEELAIQCWIAAANRLSIDLDRSYFITFVGKRTRDVRVLLEHKLASFELSNSLTNLSEELYEERYRAQGVPLKAGVHDLFDKLGALGVPAMIATSTTTPVAEDLVTRAGLSKYVVGIVGGEQVEHAKPAPDIYLLAAKKLGIAPEKAVAIEDSIPGTHAAFSAGLYTIVIPDLVQPDEVSSKMAQHILASLNHLTPHLATLFRPE